MPKYRVTAEDGVAPVSGVLYRKGAEFDWLGWPMRGVEPADEAGRRVFAYWEKNQTNPLCGPGTSPHSAIGGDFYLPHLGAIHLRARGPGDWHHSQQIPFISRPEKLRDGMPEYTVQADYMYGGAVVPAGSRVVCLSWPTDDLEAANGAAERVKAYQAEFGTHPKFIAVRAPWCEFALAVVLPDLGPLPRKPGTGRGDAYVPDEPPRDTRRDYRPSTW